MLKNQRADVPAGIVRNIGREGEEYGIMTLAELRDAQVDMFSTVIIVIHRQRSLTIRWLHQEVIKSDE
jgi:precorrin-3B C17-methyltransferase